MQGRGEGLKVAAGAEFSIERVDVGLPISMI